MFSTFTVRIHSFVLLNYNNSLSLARVVVKISNANKPKVTAAYNGSTSSNTPSALSLLSDIKVLSEIKQTFMLGQEGNRVFSRTFFAII